MSELCAETVTLTGLETLWGRGIGACTHTCATIGSGPSPAVEPPVQLKRHVVARPGEERPDADYELLAFLGEGGMSLIHEGRQAAVDRTVAIKSIKGEETEARRRSFLAEAAVIGDLEHPNIVPIYDLGVDQEGRLFYAMKRIRGLPWGRVIAERSRAENVEILLRVADAVAFAHTRGVLHRDLKPDNVMIGGFGEVLVMDWDLAVGDPRATAGCCKANPICRDSAKAGTPAYMAPEMALGRGDLIGPWSDQYLLGALLFLILAGRPPHDGATPLQCLYHAACNRVVPTDCGDRLLDVARRALAGPPEERYPGVREFREALRTAAGAG